MYSSIEDFVKRCGKCQQHGRAPAEVPIKGHPTSNTPGERWMLDCLHLNDEQLVKGGPTYTALVVAIDVCSRYAVAMPVTNLSSDTMKHFLVTQIYGPFNHLATQRSYYPMEALRSRSILIKPALS